MHGIEMYQSSETKHIKVVKLLEKNVQFIELYHDQIHKILKENVRNPLDMFLCTGVYLTENRCVNKFWLPLPVGLWMRFLLQKDFITAAYNS